MTSAEVIDCRSLAPGSLVDVETRSHHYHIECLGGTMVRISGHPQICPEPVPAHLSGALDEAGQLESGQIGCGKRMIFLLDDHLPVTTSKVLHVEVEPASQLH